MFKKIYIYLSPLKCYSEILKKIQDETFRIKPAMGTI